MRSERMSWMFLLAAITWSPYHSVAHHAVVRTWQWVLKAAVLLMEVLPRSCIGFWMSGG